jgi:hypothetical protein
MAPFDCRGGRFQFTGADDFWAEAPLLVVKNEAPANAQPESIRVHRSTSDQLFSRWPKKFNLALANWQTK